MIVHYRKIDLVKGLVTNRGSENLNSLVRPQEGIGFTIRKDISDKRFFAYGVTVTLRIDYNEKTRYEFECCDSRFIMNFNRRPTVGYLLSLVPESVRNFQARLRMDLLKNRIIIDDSENFKFFEFDTEILKAEISEELNSEWP